MKMQRIIKLKASSVMLNTFMAILLFGVMGCSDDDLEPNEEDLNDQSSNVVEPIDSLATDNTKLFFSNLYNSAQRGVILGQQESYLENDAKEYQSTCDIYESAGVYPLLSGGDIENLTNDDYVEGSWRYTRVENLKEWVKECHKRGVFVTFSWHFREPFYGDSFYCSEMDDVTKASAFKSILEGGENHNYYKERLVRLADFFKSLTDENGELIPVIFRPFHEFGGSWFWWGVPYYATPEEYVENWKFMVDYLRRDCNVHNLLYAFTPGFTTTEEYLESYPGDDYVDVFGLDSYTKADMESNYTEQSALLVSQLNIISNMAQQRGKVAALTEFGHDLLDDTKTLDEVYTKFYLDILQRIDGNIAYMMTWYNSSEKHFTPLSEEDVSYINDFTRFVQSDEVLTHEEVGSLFL